MRPALKASDAVPCVSISAPAVRNITAKDPSTVTPAARRNVQLERTRASRVAACKKRQPTTPPAVQITAHHAGETPPGVRPVALMYRAASLWPTTPHAAMTNNGIAATT